MYEKYADQFVCPQCQAPLLLSKVISKDTAEILEGIFECESNHYYPIIDGIPRLLEIRSLLEFVDGKRLNLFMTAHQKDIPFMFFDAIRRHKEAQKIVEVNTAGFYVDVWKRYDTDFDQCDARELKRLTADSLPLDSLKNATAIDVGGGGGRYLKPLLSAGVKEIFCMDLGDSINLAYRKYRHDERVLCVQADIYRLPFKNSFDFVFCIGVLQHLPDSAMGFAQLVRLADQGGQIFVWAYGHSSIQNLLMGIRKAFRRLPRTWLWNLSGFFAILRWSASKLHVGRPMLGVYDEGYSFHYFRTNTFDHLSVPIIDFFRMETLVDWLKKAEIVDYELIERFPRQANASWIIKARKRVENSIDFKLIG